MKRRASIYLLVILACTASQNSIGKDVIFVPSGFPANANATLIGYAGTSRNAIRIRASEDLFCVGGYTGLELARQTLGFSVCDSDEVSREVLTGDQLTGIDAIILIDDTQGINSYQRRLLADAIDYVNGRPQLVPFGIVLGGQRRLAGGNGMLPAGYRVIVVGEQLYRDHYQNVAAGDESWRRRITYQYRYTSRPRVQIPLAQLTTPQAIRPYFDKAVEEYRAGHFEISAEYFALLYRIPGLGQQAYEYLEHNWTRSLWSAASKYYDDSAYLRALEIFEQLMTNPLLLSIGMNDLHWNIGKCLVQLGRTAEAEQRFGAYDEEIATRNSTIRVNGPLNQGVSEVDFSADP